MHKKKASQINGRLSRTGLELIGNTNEGVCYEPISTSKAAVTARPRPRRQTAPRRRGVRLASSWPAVTYRPSERAWLAAGLRRARSWDRGEAHLWRGW